MDLVKRALITRIIVCIVLLFGFFIQAIAAQETETARPFTIGASLGYSFSGYKEETHSPVNRYLNTLTYILDGNIERGLFLHSFNLSFFMGNAKMAEGETPVLTQRYDPQNGEVKYYAYLPKYMYIRANFEYALDYRLWGDDIFPGYLGGAFRIDAYIQDPYPNVTVLATLNIHATQKWIINSKNCLILSVGLPFFGYSFRPPFSGLSGEMLEYMAESPIKIVTLGGVASLHNYWAIFTDLKYQHKVNNLLILYSGLGFELSRINYPKPRTDAIFRIKTGIAFNF